MVFISCVDKKECNVDPISSNILNESFWNRSIVFTNGEKFDTLSFVNKIEILTDTSIKAIANYEECGHLIEFNYKFSANDEPLNISLEKKENDKYIFSVKSDCVQKTFDLEQNSIKNKIILKSLNCHLIEIAFDSLKFSYYKTADNRIWRPIY